MKVSQPSLKLGEPFSITFKVPDKPISPNKQKDDFEIASKGDYYSSNATTAIAETSLDPKSPSHEKLFHIEVVICDSLPDSCSMSSRESTLSKRKQTGWC